VELTFFEVQETVPDLATATRFFERMLDAHVLFRGEMVGLPFAKLKVADLTLVLIEDAAAAARPDPFGYVRRHLGFRVRDLDRAMAELTARGAEFVVTPASVDELRRRGGREWVRIDEARPPLDPSTSSRYRFRVAIFKGPGGLFLELNELSMPADIDWHRDTDLPAPAAATGVEPPRCES
jgi:catechol 2,3-dioxygenase-like lactoylglutathione lyase family enzyme